MPILSLPALYPCLLPGLLLACNAPTTKAPNATTESPADSVPAPPSSPPSDTSATPPEEGSWKRRQDSLRQILLASKNDTLLRQSLLAEHYLRGLARREAGNLVVKIPFELHDRDVGGADCYQTELNFKFPVTTELRFPESLVVHEREHGCVDRESNILGKFLLRESGAGRVVYRSKSPPRTLVLFRNQQPGRGYAYYFPSNAEHLRGKGINEALENYTEDSELDYPYRSSILTTADYATFLE